MRKLVITGFISLDGVIENPQWTFKYWNDEIAAFKGEETESSDALLLGRVTYEGFAAAWPQRQGDGAEAAAEAHDRAQQARHRHSDAARLPARSRPS